MRLHWLIDDAMTCSWMGHAAQGPRWSHSRALTDELCIDAIEHGQKNFTVRAERLAIRAVIPCTSHTQAL